MKVSFSATPETIEQYREFAKKAVDLGATHLGVNPGASVLPSFWEWDINRNDPYPGWTMMTDGILKNVWMEELEEWIPADYSKKCMEIFSERGEVLRELGLKGTYQANEPYSLPEGVFRAHPEWRGPRTDAPRRARRPYYAPCIDHPEVLDLYRRAVTKLCEAAPVDTIAFSTNDCGAGICWSMGLYPGANGPAACEHVMMADRVSGFFSAMQEGAAAAGQTATVSMRKLHRRHEWRGVAPLLKDRQYVEGRGADMKPLRAAGAGNGVEYDRFYPVRGVLQPVAMLRALAAVSDDLDSIGYTFPTTDEPDMFELIRMSQEKPIGSEWEATCRLREFAEAKAGPEHADALYEMWMAMDRASQELGLISDGGPITLCGTINQRLLNRPFVPFPLELTDDEKSYYRPFQFQARTEEKAADLVNFQDMTQIKGRSATWIAVENMLRVKAHLQSAIANAQGILAALSDGEFSKEMRMTVMRLRAFRCVVRNLHNAIAYQGILDLTDYEEEPPEDCFLDAFGDFRGYDIRAIMRDEIDNCNELADLIDEAPEPLLWLTETPEEEDIFHHGPDLAAQLRKKTEIMLNHEADLDRLYTTPNP